MKTPAHITCRPNAACRPRIRQRQLLHHSSSPLERRLDRIRCVSRVDPRHQHLRGAAHKLSATFKNLVQELAVLPHEH